MTVQPDDRNGGNGAVSRVSLVFLAAAVALAVFAASHGFVAVRLDQVSMAAVGKVLVTLAFVALVIERAVEVYVTNTFEPRKARLRRGITLAEGRLQIAEKAVANEMRRQAAAAGAPDAGALEMFRDREATAREGLDRAKADALDDLADHRARKMRWAGGAATLLSLMAAAVGVRVLEPLLHGAAGADPAETFAQTAGALQLTAFRAADTLLTAFVLAGGADGIHKIINSVSLNVSSNQGG